MGLAPARLQMNAIGRYWAQSSIGRDGVSQTVFIRYSALRCGYAGTGCSERTIREALELTE